MKTVFLFLFFFCSLSNAAIIVKTISFDDYEENASTYLITYYPKQTFLDLGLSDLEANEILNCRNSWTPTLTCIDLSALSAVSVLRIREQSHLIDWNVYTDSLGLKLVDTNFLYALSGVLFGFSFFFVSIFLGSRIK